MLTRSTRLLLLCFCAAPLAAAETDRWTPELSMEYETIDTVIPSPDGQWVAYTRTRAEMEEERSEMLSQIHVARADGSRRFQLTAGESSAASAAFSPDSRLVYFLSDRSGQQNIWRIALDGGEAQRMTDWQGSLEGFAVSPDGNWLAFRGRRLDPSIEAAQRQKLDFKVVGTNPERHQLWLVAASAEEAFLEPRRVSQPEQHVVQFDWSADAQRIVYEHWPRPEPDFWLQADISEVQLADDAVRPIATLAVSERTPRYSPDGKLLAYVRSTQARNWAGEGRLVLQDRESGESRELPATDDAFGRGSQLLGFSSDAQRLLFTETRGTRNLLMAMSLSGDQAVLPGSASGTLSRYGRGARLNATGTHIGLARESLSEPVEAYVFDLAKSQATQVSDAHRNLPQPDLGSTEVIRWNSRDGLEIEGLLTYPVGYVQGTRVPLVLVIHGGPMGVFTQTFLGARGLYPLAAFASRGYAVLRPNPRGSSGYGQQFRMANFSDWGGGDYADIISGVDHVIELGVADPQQMAVMGWSYGGFMTSWVIGQTERFQAACVGAAVTNLWSFTGTSDILDFLPGYFGGEPWEQFEAYRKRSPMSYVQHVRTPTLILHGTEDLRVPVSQGYEFFHALQRRGVKTTMVVYPRTPHGPREPKFMLDVARRHLDWVEQHLRPN